MFLINSFSCEAVNNINFFFSKNYENYFTRMYVLSFHIRKIQLLKLENYMLSSFWTFPYQLIPSNNNLLKLVLYKKSPLFTKQRNRFIELLLFVCSEKRNVKKSCLSEMRWTFFNFLSAIFYIRKYWLSEFIIDLLLQIYGINLKKWTVSFFQIIFSFYFLLLLFYFIDQVFWEATIWFCPICSLIFFVFFKHCFSTTYQIML